MPAMSHTIVPTEAIENEEQLIILAESEEAGVFLTMSLDGKQIFVMGHPEYDLSLIHICVNAMQGRSAWRAAMHANAVRLNVQVVNAANSE